MDTLDESCMDTSDESCMDTSDESCMDTSDESYIDTSDESYIDTLDESYRGYHCQNSFQGGSKIFKAQDRGEEYKVNYWQNIS